MKCSVKSSITLLLIWALVLPCSFYGYESKAQEAENGKQLKPSEARAAQKFAELFLQQLQISKDLNRVPKKFFAAGFKDRFLNGYEWFEQDERIVAQINADERFDYYVLMFNFIYLSGLYAGGKKLSPDNLKVEDTFPPSVVALIKSKPVLAPLLNTESEWEVDNVEQLRSGMVALRDVVAALRKYLEAHPSEWEPQYKRAIIDVRDKLNDKPWSIPCQWKGCAGLPSKTHLIHVDAFPLHLVMVKAQGKLKILEIWPVSK
jgi:hypothetical protein